ncbi:MAG: hypothetical protein COA57_05630 [Flavobacteriales bacterium]|nr:MAG: hypothetical protein COA57_05630 [Flavobacteriales bacterium]
MKKHLTVFLVFIASVSFSQKELRIADWKPGETKTIEGISIYRAEGENSDKSITNIGYQTAEQMMAQIKEGAKKGSWKKEKLNHELDKYRVHNKGGIIKLYIQREDAMTANLENYTVVIKTKEEQEIQARKLKEKTPNKLSDGGGWKNQTHVWIKEKTERPFEIYVHDDSQAVRKTYKFEVTK